MVGTRSLEAVPEVDLEVDFPARVRRWTVALRLILAIPLIIPLFFIESVYLIITLTAWFFALAAGRLPDWAYYFNVATVQWHSKIFAYALLVTDRYPPFGFSDTAYPVRLALGEQQRLRRTAVLFRIVILFPALVLDQWLTAGIVVLAVTTWAAELALGRIPVALFQANVAVLRYHARVLAYFSMITSAYPKKLFGDGLSTSVSLAEAGVVTRPLLVGAAGEVWITVVLVAGLVLDIPDIAARAMILEAGLLGIH